MDHFFSALQFFCLSVRVGLSGLDEELGSKMRSLGQAFLKEWIAARLREAGTIVASPFGTLGRLWKSVTNKALLL
jgi:hypothetical protein